MTIQYQLDTTSLATLAIIAAKVLTVMYPYLQTTTKEETIDFANRKGLSAYSVYSVHNGERLVSVYRDEDEGDYHHFYCPGECDTFLYDEVKDGRLFTYSREREFDEMFLALVQLRNVAKCYPDELVLDLVKTITNAQEIGLNVGITGSVRTLQLLENNQVIWEADFYKSQTFINTIENLVNIHNCYTIRV